MLRPTHSLPTRTVTPVHSDVAASSRPIHVTVVMPTEHHGFLYDWQTLEGGALALLGAVATVIIIARQIGSTERQERARVARELMAARAVLPLTLSALSEWCEACGRILLADYGTGKIVISPSGEVRTMPSVPTDAIKGLERLIAVSDCGAADAVANLVGDIQVFVARMQGDGFLDTSYPVPSRLVLDMEGHLIGIAAIAAHVASMFDYGRRRSDQIPAGATWKQVRTTLDLFGADKDRQRKLYAMADAREVAGRRPGYVGPTDQASKARPGT